MMMMIKQYIWEDWFLKYVLTKSGQVKVANGRDAVVSSTANNKIYKNRECETYPNPDNVHKHKNKQSVIVN